MRFGVCSLGLVGSEGMRHGDVKGGLQKGFIPQFAVQHE